MAPKTILLKGDPLQKTAKSTAAAITPGDLIQNDSVAGQVERHSTGAGAHSRLFAIEDALQGNEISEDYANSSQIQYVAARPGDEIYANLADGQNITRGVYLESDGDGALVVFSAGVIVGVALETVDLSGSANLDNDGKIKIEVV